MVANIPKDTKSFLTLLFYTWRQTLHVVKKNFPEEFIRNNKSVEMVTNKPVPRPSTTFFAFS